MNKKGLMWREESAALGRVALHKPLAFTDLGTQQDQIIPPLQRSNGLLPGPQENTCKCVKYIGTPSNLKLSWKAGIMPRYNVKKVSDFPVRSRVFPARESWVSDIPSGDRKIASLFLQCTTLLINVIHHYFNCTIIGTMVHQRKGKRHICEKIFCYERDFLDFFS